MGWKYVSSIATKPWEVCTITTHPDKYRNTIVMVMLQGLGTAAQAPAHDPPISGALSSAACTAAPPRSTTAHASTSGRQLLSSGSCKTLLQGADAGGTTSYGGEPPTHTLHHGADSTAAADQRGGGGRGKRKVGSWRARLSARMLKVAVHMQALLKREFINITRNPADVAGARQHEHKAPKQGGLVPSLLLLVACRWHA